MTDPRERLANRALLVLLDNLVSQVPPALLDSLVPLDLLDKMDLKADPASE